ncbi:MAG TPA: TonB family protein [Oceanipulchritudo sp.]|nr:TonB family protein [Oceanipulchritudo sp.]
MERGTKQSLIISLLIHALFVGLALVFILASEWFEKPEPVVFELVAAAAPPSRETPEEPVEETSPQEPLRVEDPEPMRPVPEIPELPEPEPEPEPEPVRTVSFEEWSRNRELPERVQRVRQPREERSREVPQIETDVRARLERQLSSIRIEGIDLSDVESSDALQRYLGALRQRIQNAFEPSGANLEAEALFSITPEGRLTDARIQRTSGNSPFDQSVLRTLRSIRTPGPPPGNREYTFSLVFRSE